MLARREKQCSETPMWHDQPAYAGQGNSLIKGRLIQDLKAGPNVHQVVIKICYIHIVEYYSAT